MPKPELTRARALELKRCYTQQKERLIPMAVRTGFSTSQLSVALRMVGCKMRSKGRVKAKKGQAK